MQLKWGVSRTYSTSGITLFYVSQTELRVSETYYLTEESIEYVNMLCTMGCRIQVGRADTVTKAKLEHSHFWTTQNPAI